MLLSSLFRNFPYESETRRKLFLSKVKKKIDKKVQENIFLLDDDSYIYDFCDCLVVDLKKLKEI